jgi:hypothetical protein
MPWWAKYAGMHGLNAALGMLSRPQPQPAPPPDMAPQQPQAPEAQQTFYGQPDIAAMYRQIAGPSYGGGYF